MTKKTATPKKTAKTPKEVSSIKTVKKGTCPSLSGKSILTYEVGQDAKKAFYYRVLASDGGGFHSKEWLNWDNILTTLKGVKFITSLPLKALSRKRSVNTSGYILAVLLNEHLVERLPKKVRFFQLTGKLPVAKKVSPSKAPVKPTKR